MSTFSYFPQQHQQQPSFSFPSFPSSSSSLPPSVTNEVDPFSTQQQPQPWVWGGSGGVGVGMAGAGPNPSALPSSAIPQHYKRSRYYDGIGGAGRGAGDGAYDNRSGGSGSGDGFPTAVGGAATEGGGGGGGEAAGGRGSDAAPPPLYTLRGMEVEGYYTGEGGASSPTPTYHNALPHHRNCNGGDCNAAAPFAATGAGAGAGHGAAVVCCSNALCHNNAPSPKARGAAAVDQQHPSSSAMSASVSPVPAVDGWGGGAPCNYPHHRHQGNNDAHFLHLPPNTTAFDYYEPPLSRRRAEVPPPPHPSSSSLSHCLIEGEGEATATTSNAANSSVSSQGSTVGYMSTAPHSVSPQQQQSGYGYGGSSFVPLPRAVSAHRAGDVRVWELEKGSDDSSACASAWRGGAGAGDANEDDDDATSPPHATTTASTAAAHSSSSSPRSASHAHVTEVIKSLITKKPISDDARLLQRLMMPQQQQQQEAAPSSYAFPPLSPTTSSSSSAPVLMLTWGGGGQKSSNQQQQSAAMGNGGGSAAYRTPSADVDGFVGFKRMRPLATVAMVNATAAEEGEGVASAVQMKRYRPELGGGFAAVTRSPFPSAYTEEDDGTN